jgi:hypothetical protein
MSRGTKRQAGIYPTYTHVLFRNGSSGPLTHPGVEGQGWGILPVGLCVLSVGSCVCGLVCVYLPLVVSDLGKHLKRPNGAYFKSNCGCWAP